MSALLKNKRALITGATGVIGQAIARAFAQEGCALVLTGRSPEKLEGLKAELEVSGVKIATVSADMSHEVGVESLFKDLDQLDILVLAHGTYGYIGPLSTAGSEAWLEAIKINLLGAVLAIKYAGPLLAKSGAGKIIVLAGGGEGPLPNFSSYAASKAAILRLTETLAAELKGAKIEINAISPGAVNSGLNQDILAAGPERAGQKMYEQTLKQISGEEGISTDKAAALALFLASDESNGLSGKNISAVWDNWREIPKHIKELQASDVYNLRRIKPGDRGYDW